MTVKRYISTRLFIGAILTLGLLAPITIATGIPAASAAITTYPSFPGPVICDTSMLNGPATAPPGAVLVAAGDNSTVTFGQSNTTYWFAPGTHTIGTGIYSQIQPGASSTYEGAPGAVLDGQGRNYSAFTTTVGHVTIKYLTIQKFISLQDQGVVNHDSGDSWIIQYNTVQNNRGAAVFLGSNSTTSYNCLRNNGQYGYSAYKAGGDSNITLDHNEISGNNTDNWEVKQPGCGCSGAGKIWATVRGNVTNNWIHNNHGPAVWADTNNTGLLIDHNYINDNDGSGVEYEISYNAHITNNNIIRNAIVEGQAFAARGDTFPVGAIYISESGGDSRVDGGYLSDFTISGNNLTDNWGGVVLWENADRFCGSAGDAQGAPCTLGNPTQATLQTCQSGHFTDGTITLSSTTLTSQTVTFTPGDIGAVVTGVGIPANDTIANVTWQDPKTATLMVAATLTKTGTLDFIVGGRSATNQINAQPYLSDCRWKTQNVSVKNNSFAFSRANVSCTTTYCGEQATLSNFGSSPAWSPYHGLVVDDAITYSQNNHFSNNVYTGDWTFAAHGTATGNFRSWQAPLTSQDVNSNIVGTGSPITNIIDPDTAGLENAQNPLGYWRDWFSTTPTRITAQSHTGTASLLVTVAAPYGWGDLTTNWPGFAATPGFKTASFWALAGRGTLSAKLNVVWADSNGNALQTDVLTAPTLTSGWQQTTANNLNAPNGTSFVRLQLDGTTGNVGDSAYFDDFYVADRPVNVLDANTSDIEGSLGSWVNWYTATPARSTAQAHTGVSSMQVTMHPLNPGSGWGIQTGFPGFAETPGVKTISFWGREGSAPVDVTMQVQFLDSTPQVIQTNTMIIPTLTTAWQQAIATVVAPPGTATVRVEFYGVAGIPGDYLYIDTVYVGA